MLVKGTGGNLLRGPSGNLANNLACCCNQCCEFTCSPATYPDPVFLTMVWSSCSVLTGTFQLDAGPCVDDTLSWSYSGTIDGCDITISMACEVCFGGGTCYIITITLGTASCLVINLQGTIVSCDPFEIDFAFDLSSNSCGVGEDCSCDDTSFVSASVSE